METHHNDKAATLISYIRHYITLSKNEEEYLRSKLLYRNYLKGQYVAQQGDICRFESFIIQGCVNVFYLDPNGQKHVILLGVENWWIGDLGSFINRNPADYNIQCLEDCELVQFTRESLEDLYHKIPPLERFFRLIIQNAFIASQKRLVNNHCMSAKERYRQFRTSYPELNQRVPQYLVASYLGITKEFLSKIKSQLISEEKRTS